MKGTRPRKDLKIIVNRERCTGCGRCVDNCPMQALSLSRIGIEDRFQLIFRLDCCDACGRCEGSCPESCLRLEEKLEEKGSRKVVEVLFEDKICRCAGCGAPLFPRAMVKNVAIKIFGAGKPTWPIERCLSCRLKSQTFQSRVGT